MQGDAVYPSVQVGDNAKNLAVKKVAAPMCGVKAFWELKPVQDRSFQRATCFENQIHAGIEAL
eukprot:9627647-Lingulodinium_polyedra.AAC.1